jgi:hypothetical protein
MPAFTTLERVKTFLGLDLAASVDDVWLNYSIQSASRLLETLTGRTFGERIWNIRLEQPFGFRRLQLPHTPVVSVSEIKFRDNPIDPTTYLIEDPEAGFLILKSGQAWPSTSAASYNVSGRPSQQPIGFYEVEFVAGYADIPEDVVDAVTQQVILQYHRRGRDTSVKGISVLGDSVSYASGLESQYHPAFSAVLSRYTNVPVL